ncbi:MAG TPA: Gfo/Idh/MocA family oxidoreductase [Terriglobales bacterium]|nr:Gfo/Idh/MocA family oxidoreductase [Terriglobales bacterium]
MTDIIGVGVIGTGWMGTAHSRAYLQAAERFPDSGIRAKLVICADEVEGRAQEAQHRFGFERHTTRWQDVIRDPDVQAVNVTTPNFMHLEIVTAAASAGKHIFCEKPVGRNAGETAEIDLRAREAGVLTFVGFNYRWAPMVQYARQLIRDEKLGRLTHFRGRFLAGYASSPETPLSWRFQQELSGSGVSGDLLTHVVDMSLFLAGPIKRVVGNRETFIQRRPSEAPSSGSSRGVMKDVTNEDYVGALVQFANGAHGNVEVCRVIQGRKCDWGFEVEGTQGAVSWNFERMNELNVFLPDGNAGHEGYTRIVSGPNYPFHGRFNPATGTGLGYDDLKTIESHHFLKSIAEKRQGEPGFAEAVRVAEVLAAIERTCETGNWQEVTSVRAQVVA